MSISLFSVRIKSLEFSYGGCPIPLVLKSRLFFSSQHLCVCVCMSIHVCVFNLEYSLQELMLKLKLQYFGPLMQTADSLEKSLMLGKIEGRRRGCQRIRWLDGIMDAMDMNLAILGAGEGQRHLACCSPWGHKELDITGWHNNTHTHIYIFTFQIFVNAYMCMCIYTFYTFLSMWWWLVIILRNLACGSLMNKGNEIFVRQVQCQMSQNN